MLNYSFLMLYILLSLRLELEHDADFEVVFYLYLVGIFHTWIDLNKVALDKIMPMHLNLSLSAY